MSMTSSFNEEMTVKNVTKTSQDTYVYCTLEDKHLFMLPMSDTDYAWRRVKSVDTLPSFRVAEPAYGATCKKCNTHNEYAEAQEEFVCGPCRTWA